MSDMTTEYTTANFSAKELRCKCGACRAEIPHEVQREALDLLQAIRSELGESMPLSSAYRCPLHPNEVNKKTIGRHRRGIAFDILVPWGRKRARIIELALIYGARGFGFADTFIHIDFRSGDNALTTWGYS